MTKLLTPAEIIHRLMPGEANSDRVRNSSARVERRTGKKPGNAEQSIGAHLIRLEELMNRGKNVKNRVWKSAVKENIIAEDEIPEAYWKQQEQLLRDNGIPGPLSQSMKNELTGDIRSKQRESLEQWSTYFDQTADQYPMWFKYYVWNSITKLGSFDERKGRYRKRSNRTIAPYPTLNPAALAKTYDILVDYSQGTAPDDETLRKLADSGNFSKLYSHIMLEQKAIIPTPENPEDIHGDWHEYTANDIETITKAAEGTPWCIAGKTTARDYTADGGKFLLFHLTDPETGQQSETACVSIRLDDSGRVAELSGLKGGKSQYIEDSLLPTAEEKVKDLPGGERYLQAFADKQILIAMDRKVQADEPFTVEETDFIYELNRRIAVLDTYQRDPRIDEFREYQQVDQLASIAKRYNEATAEFMEEHADITIDDIDELMKKGVPIDAILPRLSLNDIAKNITKLREAGADVDFIVSRLEPGDIAWNITRLLEAGANVNLIVSRLKPKDIAYHITELLEAGADANLIVSRLKPRVVAENITGLREAGADINANELIPQLKPEEIADNITGLREAGADINANELIPQLKPRVIARNIIGLREAGADINANELIPQLNPKDILYNITGLLEADADVDLIVSRLEPGDIAWNITRLLEAGADIDLIVSRLEPMDITHYITKLLEAGADANLIVSRLEPRVIAHYITKLLEAGADKELIKRRLAEAGLDTEIAA